jgi:ABC-type transporter Mla MlaB component
MTLMSKISFFFINLGTSSPLESNMVALLLAILDYCKSALCRLTLLGPPNCLLPYIFILFRIIYIFCLFFNLLRKQFLGNSVFIIPNSP